MICKRKSFYSSSPKPSPAREGLRADFNQLYIISMNQSIHFSLQLSYDQYLRVYQGSAKNISVVADDARKIIFPARNMQQFLTKDGINGHFEMELTNEHKFISVKKLD